MNNLEFINAYKDMKKLGELCKYENVNYSNRTAVLGIFIGNPDYRSNGYGTEAIKLLLLR